MGAFGITWRPSFVVCHLLTFHILIFSSETHLGKRFQRRFKKIGQSEKIIACGGHVCK
jgi:hypothetical protein